MSGPSARPGIALMIESDGPGGAEFVLLNLATALGERGYRICPVGPAEGCGWLDSRLRERGFEPETFTIRAPVDPLCLAGIVRSLHRRGVDLIHSHEFTMAVYGAAAAMVLGVPHVVTMHGGRGFADRRRRRVALRWALTRSRPVAVSEAARDHLLESLQLPGEVVQVIPNGIVSPVGQGGTLRRQLSISSDTILILAVGNLYTVKGHDVLLRALGILSRRRPELDWRLMVAGRGGEKDKLERILGEEDLRQRVHLLGYRADIPDLLAASDLFVMPSRSEGLPLSLLEAMMAGLPVVASSVGGIPEVLAGDLSVGLVPAGDAEALADRLEMLLTQETRRCRLGHLGRRRAIESYGVDRMVDAYEELYGLEVEA